MSTSPSIATFEALTSRESQVLTLVREGRSSKEIARELGIARSTVRCHVQRVLTKLGVATRLQAAVLATDGMDPIPVPSEPVPSEPVLSKPVPSTPGPGLTPREAEVLRCIAAGIGRAEIARHLFISPHTARTHVQRVLGKLNVHSALAAMALVRRAGLAPAQAGLASSRLNTCWACSFGGKIGSGAC